VFLVRSIFKLFPFAFFLLVSASASAGHYFERGYICADDAGGVGSCTANEINIASVNEGDLTDAEFCVLGQPVEVSNLEVTYGLNTGERYDPLLWVGQTGNDPRDAGGICYVASIPPGEEGPVFAHLEGASNDSCLDVSKPELGDEKVPYPEVFTVECKDSDGDINGYADFQAIVSWVQNQGLMCGPGDIEGERFAPGAPPKCDWSLISLQIPVYESILTITKVIESNNGGTATLADFDVSVDGAEINWENPASSTGETKDLAATEPGTYSLSEADVSGYAEGTWSCVDSDDNEVAVSNGGAFDGADVTVGTGKRVFCTITNNDQPPPTLLTVIKTVLNDNGGDAVAGEWTMVVTASNPSNNNFPGVEAPGTTITIDAGAYSVDESGGPSGYTKTLSAGCNGLLAAGESATCTITNNDDAPTLTLSKVVDNSDGGSAGPNDFGISVAGNEVVSGATNAYTANIPLEINEILPENYVFIEITGDDKCPGALGGTVTLDEGEDISCTITNKYTEKPMLTVIKQVINDNGGDAAAGEWTMVVTATNPSSNNFPGAENPGTTITIDAGAYSVDESGGPSGYTKTLSAGCSGELAVNESATCTITNDDDPAQLTVIKQVINNDGGTAVAADWTMDVTGSNPGNNNFPGVENPGTTITIDAGAYSVDESGGPDGETDYIKTLGPGCDGNLAPGESASCTITNDDAAGSTATLTLQKEVDNEGGGDKDKFDWTLTASGPVVRSGVDGSAAVTDSIVPIGVYTLSENGPGGYQASDWSCDGGSLNGAQLTLDADDVVICTITNTFDGAQAKLTLIKNVINNDGGTAGENDFGISVDGNVVQSGAANDYPTSKPLVINETMLANYNFVSITGDAKCPGELGGSVTLEDGDDISCTITNDDFADSPQDVSVTKSFIPLPYGCPAVNGGSAEFSILVTNNGTGTAKDVILDDHWTSQLKPAKSPDMYECALLKENWARCKLGNMAAGSSKKLLFDYYIGGEPGEEACNTALVSSAPAETDDTENNESMACFSFVGQFGSPTGELPEASIGISYDQLIEIVGGLLPYETTVTGLPAAGLNYELNSEGNLVRITGCPTFEQGKSIPISVVSSYFGDSLEQACGSFEQKYTLNFGIEFGCSFGLLTALPIEQRGTTPPGSRDQPLPDETVQKAAVDEQGNHYLAGFIYADHVYANDPNGAYIDHKKNYDIRLTKFNSSGVMLWDKTYDTGNDDYGYAVTYSLDKQRIYVGGHSEVEDGTNAWHDAVLLEIDNGSGCIARTHFQSSGPATTSAYYDIAIDGADIYAVGELQSHPAVADTDGAMISVYRQQASIEVDACADDIIISAANADELQLQQNFIRPGNFPTVAYSVKPTGSGCVDCGVLVGGRSGADGGWVDKLDSANVNDRETVVTLADMRVQDIAVQEAHFIVVGSSSDNDMMVRAYDWMGGSDWNLNIGKGRLRGVTTDAKGFIYAVGTSDGEGTSGLIFKYDDQGNEIATARLNPGGELGTDVSFHDVANLGSPRGIIAGQFNESPSDLGGLQVEYNCIGACEP